MHFLGELLPRGTFNYVIPHRHRCYNREQQCKVRGDRPETAVFWMICRLRWLAKLNHDSFSVRGHRDYPLCRDDREAAIPTVLKKQRVLQN